MQENMKKVENHSSASMSTTKIVIIYKTKNVSILLGRKGPLLGTFLVVTVSCPLEAPPLPHPKKQKPYMVASESPSEDSSDPLSDTKAEELVS